MFKNFTFLLLILLFSVNSLSYAVSEPEIFPGLRKTGGENCINLMPLKQKPLGKLVNKVYSRKIGFSSDWFSINLPKFLTTTDYEWLQIKEHEMKQIEYTRQSGNGHAYVSFGPGACDRTQYFCAIALTVQPVSEQQVSEISNQVFENFRHSFAKTYHVKTNLIFNNTTTFDNFPARYAAFKIPRQENFGDDYLYLFYHVSYSPRLHVTYVQLVPGREISKSDLELIPKRQLTNMQEWMRTFKTSNL